MIALLVVPAANEGDAMKALSPRTRVAETTPSDKRVRERTPRRAPTISLEKLLFTC
jgi:hypothetical protein